LKEERIQNEKRKRRFLPSGKRFQRWREMG